MRRHIYPRISWRRDDGPNNIIGKTVIGIREWHRFLVVTADFRSEENKGTAGGIIGMISGPQNGRAVLAYWTLYKSTG